MNPAELSTLIKAHLLRILILLVATVLVGGVTGYLVYRQMHGKNIGVQTEPQFKIESLDNGFSIADSNKHKEVEEPSPTSFKAFFYNPEKGQTLKISGKCTDTYYTLVIFETSADYRKDSGTARFNTAYPCPENGKFQDAVDLKPFHLPAGTYYFFVADQGKTGTWYNPR